MTIDRPDVRNAVDGRTAHGLYDAFVDFEHHQGLSVAVLTGAGGQFCAGADLKAIASGLGNPVGAEPPEEIVGSIGPMGPTRLSLDKPVIAAVEGFAVAGGLELALWCDLRVVARDAKLGVFCRRWGVPLVDGGTVRLGEIIGAGRAMDLILTGREVDASEAFTIGLANRIVDSGSALEEAVALARELSELPQRCLRSDRRSAIAALRAETLGHALSYETEAGLETIESGETLEGAARFLGGAGRHGARAD